MSQLLNRGINTVPYTNALLRRMSSNNGEFENIIMLRADGYNLPEFSKLSIYKPLALDLARQVDAEIITDLVLIITESGNTQFLESSVNRLVFVLAGESTFTQNDNRYNPSVGDLIWTNEDLTIENTSDNKSIVLILDFKEMLL